MAIAEAPKQFPPDTFPISSAQRNKWDNYAFMGYVTNRLNSTGQSFFIYYNEASSMVFSSDPTLHAQDRTLIPHVRNIAKTTEELPVAEVELQRVNLDQLLDFAETDFGSELRLYSNAAVFFSRLEDGNIKIRTVVLEKTPDGTIIIGKGTEGRNVVADPRRFPATLKRRKQQIS